MEFTVKFDAPDGLDLSYDLLFVPCPVWAKGEKHMINLNPENPHYQIGSVRKLVDAEKLASKLGEADKSCLIVVHPHGHATTRDLETLEADLQQEGFRVTKQSS